MISAGRPCHPALLLFVALVPMVFDAGAGFLGLYETSFLIRTADRRSLWCLFFRCSSSLPPSKERASCSAHNYRKEHPMPEKPNKLMPALYGGIIMGVISGIPFLNLLNCCCCAGVLLGGALAVFFYKNDLKEGMPPLTSGDAIELGALAGVIGAVIGSILTAGFLAALGNVSGEAIMGILEGFKDQMPPGTLEQMEEQDPRRRLLHSPARHVACDRYGLRASGRFDWLCDLQAEAADAEHAAAGCSTTAGVEGPLLTKVSLLRADVEHRPEAIHTCRVQIASSYPEGVPSGKGTPRNDTNLIEAPVGVTSPASSRGSGQSYQP